MRRERIKGFISGVILSALLLWLGTTAYASYQRTATLDYTGIKITMDGKAVTPTDATGNLVEPFAIEGTTYLPIRAIAEALGLTVSWDGSTSTVVLTSQEAGKTVYITRTGSKYHYDGTCNGGTYWSAPYDTAVGMGLEPCAKCVH